MKKTSLTRVSGLLAAALLLAACNNSPTNTISPANPATPISTPASEATQPAAGSTADATSAPSGEASDPAADWNRVKSSGKLMVGSAIDYPPFSYYNPDFTVDGFDIALIKEIAKRLNVTAEITDFAFDGLLNAVNLDQLDVAIAAISITPERQQKAEFSEVYYVGEDAILAPADSTASITAVDGLAGKRVGVQNGSTYANWLRDQLVTPGKTPAGDLLLYSQMDTAVNDLKDKKLDYVVLGQLPADEFAKGGGIKVVGQNINRQEFGIAAQKGQTELIKQINTALDAIRADGTFEQLTKKYLQPADTSGDLVPTVTPDVAPNVPTATPPPTLTSAPTAVPPTAGPTAAPACVDGMAFVNDLNYDDNNMTSPPIFGPGQSFTKSWRVRNTGNCAWPASYLLAYSYGNVGAAQMGGTSVAVGRAVPPGGTVDISTNLVAPTAPGTYQGFWTMRGAGGVAFGQVIWVGITVPGAPTPVPPPTAPPPPAGATINFSANATTINAGQPVVLSWNTANVQAVYFYVQGDPNWANNGVAGTDSRTLYPNQSVIYELRVILTDGSTQFRQILVNVNAVVGAPVISSFTSNVQGQLSPGQCIVFSWSIQGQVTRVSFFVNGGVAYDGAPVNGTYTHCPATPGAYTYEIGAQGPGGNARQQLGFIVKGNAPPPPSNATLTPIP